MKLYVQQDGADFYVHSDPECTILMKERCCSAPFKVGDYDMHAAHKAREWFNEYGYFKGADEAIFCGPMGYTGG